MDVISLYTNIPHAEAIKIISKQYQETLYLWQSYNTKLTPLPIKTLKKFFILPCLLANSSLITKLINKIMDSLWEHLLLSE